MEQLKEELRGLPTETFFSFGDEHESELNWKMLNADFKGLLIAVPESVDLAEHDHIPLILLSAYDALRLWDVDSMVNTIIAVTDLERGYVYWEHAFPINKRYESGSMKSRQGPEPEGANALINAMQARKIDLTAVCGLPSRTGRYAVTLIYHDWISNTEVVEVVDSSKEPFELEEEREMSVEAISKELIACAVNFYWDLSDEASREEGLPDYGKSELSPDLEEAGIAIAAPATISEETERIPVYGTVKTPAPLYASIPEIPEERRRDIPKGRIPSAVLKGKLLLIKKDERVVSETEILVPVRSEDDIKADDLTEGYFAIDLMPRLQTSLDAGEYLLYFVSYRFIHGPNRIVYEKSLTEP